MKLSRDHYKADACIIWCFDNRFWPAFEEFRGESEINHFDPVFVAGGAKALGVSDQKNDQDFLLKQIEISIKLHGTKKVILMTHEDCGAFGGSKSFIYVGEELSQHERILGAGKAKVHDSFPNLEITAYFATFNGLKEI